MEQQMCTVTVNGKTKQYEAGTTYQEIAKEVQQNFEQDIILVFVNDRLQELHKKVSEDCLLQFVTTGEDVGHKTYKRSMSLLLVKAIYDVMGTEKVPDVRIEFSVDQGLYVTIREDIKIDSSFLQRVDARMRALADADLPITKRSIRTEEASALFHKSGMYDKERLFRYRLSSMVNIYCLDGFEDYYYGYMAPSTGYLKYFTLYPYDEGFVLQMPTVGNPKEVPPFAPKQKLFDVLKESTCWGDMQHIETVGDLNDVVTQKGPRQMILVQEALQEKKIAEIAEEIKRRKGVKFVLIAGPSSSGKTTFSYRLSVQLQANGLMPYPLAVDNYFVNREETPKDEKGNYDFECMEAIDVELFNRDLTRLLAGEQVELPTFDFKTGVRKYDGKWIQLKEQDVLIIEGIHCLNPELTKELPDKNKFKIYISALTQLNIDEHNRISTTDSRLIRRIVRDAKTRGSSAQKTIGMWYSVRRGEEKNIFPYQEEADVMFNSALIYELAVLKQYAQPLLFGVERDSKEYLEAKRLLKFLDYFVGIETDYIPMNSLLREFIGGGCFDL